MSDGTLAERFATFDEILKYVLVQTKGEPTAIATAKAMSIPVNSLYAYADGSRRFPIDLLVGLVNATDEPDFLRWFSEQTGYDLYKRPEPGSVTKLSLFEQLTVVTREQTEVTQAALDAIRDGKVTQDELAQVCTEVNELVRAATELKALATTACVATARGGGS